MILRNSFFNLMGLGAPLLVALFTIPVLIDVLGDDRFGILTLIWAIVSYFGLFDLGLGRALTLQLSRYLTTHKESESGEVVWTALLIMFGLGVVAGVALYFGALLGLSHVESILGETEKTEAVFYLALAVPFIVMTTGYRGVLEAKSEFLLINIIRLPMGIFTFVGPLLVVLYWEISLGAIALVLFVGRVVGCLVHAIIVHRTFQGLRMRPSLSRACAKLLFYTGGWMSVSNIIGPLMGYVDRFIIGFLVSAAAVAYYATPHEIVMKLGIIPGALTAVMFPNIAASYLQDKKKVKELFVKGLVIVSIVMIPITIVLSVFSYDILALWITPEFAEKSYLVFVILSIGMMVSCLAQLPYSLIQGAGHSKTTALIHLCEFPLFVIALWIAVDSASIIGAALVWCFRATIDAMLMFGYSHKLLSLRNETI
jgi:O-antigen/teichoic acid export membrane protein